MADDSNIKFILDAIFGAGRIEMDFKQLAINTGISRSDNAGTKFQNHLKKCGFKYDKDQSRLIKLDGTTAAATPVKKAATNGQKGSGKKGTPKKRKLEDLLDSASEDEGSSKGMRKTKEEDQV